MNWWSESSQLNGVPIVPPATSLVIELDVSNMGWVATDGYEQTGGLCSMEEAAYHIASYELDFLNGITLDNQVVIIHLIIYHHL